MQQSESAIQASIFTWFSNAYCLKHHNPRWVILSIPNGGTRHRLEAMTLKATGLLPGASDLVIIGPQITLWVEVKTDTGKQSPEQIDFQSRIEALGHTYLLVRSLEGFKEIVRQWVNMEL